MNFLLLYAWYMGYCKFVNIIGVLNITEIWKSTVFIELDRLVFFSLMSQLLVFDDSSN